MNTNSSIYFSVCTGNEGVPGFVVDSGNTMVDQKQSQPCLQGAYELTRQQTTKYHMNLLERSAVLRQESNPEGRSAQVPGKRPLRG